MCMDFRARSLGLCLTTKIGNGGDIALQTRGLVPARTRLPQLFHDAPYLHKIVCGSLKFLAVPFGGRVLGCCQVEIHLGQNILVASGCYSARLRGGRQHLKLPGSSPHHAVYLETATLHGRTA